VAGGPIPFLLLHAHDSRLQVPFLQYVNDDVHRWKVCIGLPNGTGKWQVGDSSEQNGNYKTEMTREKGKLILFKTRIGCPTVIEKSDAIPLVNITWTLSFARVDTNKKAIVNRGWYPANRMLLLDAEILKTKAVSTIAVINQPMDDISVLPGTTSSLTTPNPGVNLNPTAPGVNLNPTAAGVNLTADLDPDPADDSAKTFAALDKLNMGIQGRCYDFIVALYRRSTIGVCLGHGTGAAHTKPFDLKRELCQGCPLCQTPQSVQQITPVPRQSRIQAQITKT
jgi:hypothetical protein